MANIKSQKKRILTNAKRAERNKAVKSELKTRVKNAADAIGTDDDAEAVRLAVKRLDMAAAKGVIHPNQAARRKSRLMKQGQRRLQLPFERLDPAEPAPAARAGLAQRRASAGAGRR